MQDFATQLSSRADDALDSLREAHAGGEDYLVEVRVGELEGLLRVAADHGVDMPQVTDALSRYGETTDLPLPETSDQVTGPVQMLAADTRDRSA